MPLLLILVGGLCGFLYSRLRKTPLRDRRAAALVLVMVAITALVGMAYRDAPLLVLAAVLLIFSLYRERTRR